MPVAQAPALTLDKAITAGDPYTVPDHAIGYEYTVTNSGDVTLAGTLAVADDRVTVACDPAAVTLAPGETATCSASHRVTQADLDAGSVTNTATATLDGVTSDPASATAEADQAPALSDRQGPHRQRRRGRLGHGQPRRHAALDDHRHQRRQRHARRLVSDDRTSDATTVRRRPGPTASSRRDTVRQADVDAGVIANSARPAPPAPAR